ncbi:alpha-ketoglutarate-dependent dioxygenase AlkB [Blastococcus sp. Marseille-P5729]|uniref:alpha-ketoglutarate-dependent dioxygenase AlkB n=1 Tax=Blastococcus sp. Marseille-P5729 TaxID=2086582 RepID=UPI000D0EE741|nr:alpha-ketoglutarate-dependent dioxygenase AlkB [Blastococcus sp. Marseille-P5729]
MLLQGSLLDLDEDLHFGPLSGVRRTVLAHQAWVDHLAGWASGTTDLFEQLLETVDWRADKRVMYDRVIEVPRLTRFYREGEPLPHHALEEARELLSDHYRHELGERFVSAGMCLYRDARDSVAWHGDREGRAATGDTMVAILSLGTPRTLALRERLGGPTRHRFRLGHGDLVVMGGSCQRTWDHAVPKASGSLGPRISVQFRTRGVR